MVVNYKAVSNKKPGETIASRQLSKEIAAAGPARTSKGVSVNKDFPKVALRNLGYRKQIRSGGFGSFSIAAEGFVRFSRNTSINNITLNTINHAYINQQKAEYKRFVGTVHI